MAYSERELLARIVQCEAGGEGDNGMRAVASVVMNRVNVPNGEYARVSQGGNIRIIIFCCIYCKVFLTLFRQPYHCSVAWFTHFTHGLYKLIAL